MTIEITGLSSNDSSFASDFNRYQFKAENGEFIGQITICFPDASVEQIKKMLMSVYANIEQFEKVNKL